MANKLYLMGDGKKKRLMSSVAKRWREINEIYDKHAKDGISNREIWRKYIYPKYAICERQMYTILKHDGILY